MIDKLNNATQFTEILMERFVSPGEICVDATAGNGYDTSKLAHLVGEEGFVYAFDIQREAVQRAGELLKGRSLLERVRLIQDSHAHLDKHISVNIDFIIYNLGYLPGGDKAVRTNAEATISSIDKALAIMNPGAIMLVTSYRGHEGGLAEYIAVKEYFEALSQEHYNVFEFLFINQKNNPPITIGLEVRGGRTWER